jgi:signal transduction histidine kinase
MMILLTINNENIILAIGGTIILFAIVVFFITFLFMYQKRHHIHVQEIEGLKSAFQRTLLQSQLEIQKQTFNDISREIHDNVGQILSVTKMQLNFLDENNKFDKQILKEARENISTALADLRDIAKSMSGDRLQSIPLDELISKEIAVLRKTSALDWQVKTEGIQKTIDNSKKLILFRIVQECLQNIIKHAEASRVLITFSYKTDKINIAILDNGKGFDTAMKQNTGLGLQNIVSRAALIGGTAVIESNPGNGAKITITSPYE